MAVAAFGLVAAPAAAAPQHGIAMHGEPALPPDFPHLPYADPDAPQGGRIGYASVGSFDSLNPFIVRGTAPRALWDTSWGNNVWESLLVRNRDEPFSLYGLLAETVETPPDRSWVEFTLRPEARFSDGMPVTADDVIFSAELLRDKGRPNYRTYYANVARMEKVGERGVRFTFHDGADREQPLLIGLMPILPRHAIDAETFDRTSLKPFVGSGPYLIERVDPGSRIVLRKNPDYWGADLPVKRGFDNFDEIRVEYFRDANAYFEAFKKGLFDLNPESEPARWATGYDFPAVANGLVVLDEFPTGLPAGMNGFVFNTRRPVFQDPVVREALGYFFDFEWINQNLYHGLYKRTGGYFDGSELSALGRPASERERELLARYPEAVRPEVTEGTWRAPESDGSGRDRDNLRAALQLLAEAGYERRDGRLVHAESGRPLAFEVLVQTREQERLALAFQRTLGLGGIQVSVRQVDSAQYEERRKTFDFDVVQFVYPASLSPGSEQYFRWSQAAAEAEGSFNLAGASDPAIDAMIAAMLEADSREDFVAAVRALDRVLISGFYVVPLFHAPGQWIARWTRVDRPEKGSLYGAEPTTWWAAQ
jgi:peptide/nickel transport system substrate-binding protein